MFMPDLDKDKLFERLKYSLTKKDVIYLAESYTNSGIDIEEIISLTLSCDNSIAFHSAWVLENMLLSYTEALDYYLPVLVEYLPKIINSSVQRHIAKLVATGIERIVKRQTSRVFDKEFWQTNLEPLEEVCFHWLVDENCKPAVKAHCMDILYYLSQRQKWIAEELPYIIENQMDMGTPALRAKGKKVLKMLKTKKTSIL